MCGGLHCVQFVICLINMTCFIYLRNKYIKLLVANAENTPTWQTKWLKWSPHVIKANQSKVNLKNFSKCIQAIRQAHIMKRKLTFHPSPSENCLKFHSNGAIGERSLHPVGIVLVLVLVLVQARIVWSFTLMVPSVNVPCTQFPTNGLYDSVAIWFCCNFFFRQQLFKVHTPSILSRRVLEQNLISKFSQV